MATHGRTGAGLSAPAAPRARPRRADLALTVPMRYVRGIAAAASRRGVALAPLLEAARIDESEFAAERSRVSLNQFSRLFLAVAVALDDEALGLAVQRVPRGTVEIMCRAGLSGQNVLESVAIVATVLNACSRIGSVRLEAGADGPSLTWAPRPAQPGDEALLTEIDVLTTYAVISWLAGERAPLARVEFPFQAPRNLFELRSLLPGRLRFGRPRAALCFAPAIAAMPVRRHPSEVGRFVRQAPASLIECIVARGATATRVRELLRESLPDAPSLAQVAARLSLSQRTMHRRLEREGQSFQSIKDQLRRDLAIHALTRTAHPLKRIAVELGFADQAAFQRAFQRWTGNSPGEYRRRSRRA